MLYLLAGGWNTLFGFFVMIWLYTLMSNFLHVAVIATIANVLSITMSFLTYRYFVFKSKNVWWAEYLKCYVIYGALAAFSIVMTSILVDYFELRIWISQLITVPTTIIVSYVGHKHFTFAERNEKN